MYVELLMIESLIKKIKDKFSKSEYDEEEYDEEYEEGEYEEGEYEEGEYEEDEELDNKSKKNKQEDNKKIKNASDDKEEEEEEEDDYEYEDEDEENDDEGKDGLDDDKGKEKEKKSKVIQIFAFAVIVYVVLTWEDEPKKEKKENSKKSEKLANKNKNKKKKIKKKANKVSKKEEVTKTNKVLPKQDNSMALLDDATPELDSDDFGLGDDFLTNEGPKKVIKKTKETGLDKIQDKNEVVLAKKNSTNIIEEERNPASMVVSKPGILTKSLRKKIKKKKDEYTKPPNYSFRGRGLVYNCKGKHWACVDKESYLSCRENEKWQKRKNKEVECKTIDVYRSNKDCSIIQLHNIHTLVKTDFCKK